MGAKTDKGQSRTVSTGSDGTYNFGLFPARQEVTATVTLAESPTARISRLGLEGASRSLGRGFRANYPADPTIPFPDPSVLRIRF